MIISNQVNQLDSMYPAFNHMLNAGDELQFSYECKWSSLYGYSFGSNKIKIGDRVYYLEEGQYFSLFCGENIPEFDINSKLFLVVRLGYKCQNTMGWVEKQGRLSYIDGCTDSLLIYPPRMGDPSMSLLYFPGNVEQTKHLHPSIRIGCVIDGSGWADYWDGAGYHTVKLQAGTNFCLEENEMHRFRTETLKNTETYNDDYVFGMTVIAWHPDGDWGPTDHNHTMLNRTYIKQ